MLSFSYERRSFTNQTPYLSMENSDNLVYGLRLSTAVPSRVTGDGKLHELKGVDLAMKLHYIRALYFFANNNINATFLCVSDIKNAFLFDWLETYFVTCGRVRLPKNGGAPPAIKFNDAGIRIVEANSSKSLDQWLAMPNFTSLNHHLTYNHVLGPDLCFTPLVFLQVTWFKCGGVSVGLSWAHILGDAFAATMFMNSLGGYLEGHLQPKAVSIPADDTGITIEPNNLLKDPLCIKRVKPVEDGSWVAPTNDMKMETHSFWVSREQLSKLKLSKKYGCFEVMAGVIWKKIAKIRKENEPRTVTVCRPKPVPTDPEREHVIPYNGQLIGRVVSKSSKVSDADLWDDLVSEIAGNVVDETEMLDKYCKTSVDDTLVVYGANLTFVDMVDADVYGFQLKGQSPVYASYNVDGIGDQGVVVVLPGPTPLGKMLIVLTLPHSEMEPLKTELMEQWSIIA